MAEKITAETLRQWVYEVGIEQQVKPEAAKTLIARNANHLCKLLAEARPGDTVCLVIRGPQVESKVYQE